ncbi:MAG: DUF998 domain-containing protein [Vicinamibacterales bacterium]
MTTRRAVILVGCGLFVAIMLSLHLLRQDLSPLTRGMSRYAGAGTLGLATIGFLALTAAVIALATLLRHPRPAAVRGLVTAACGLLAVVVTPIGNPNTPVPVTTLHTIGGIAFYLGMVWAMRSSASEQRDRQFGRATTTALALFVLGAVGLPGFQQIVGLLQRLVFALVVGWVIQAALRCRADTSQPHLSL